LPTTLDEWYDATRKTVQRWQDLNDNIGPKGGPGHISTRANRMHRYQKAPLPKRQRDPDAMDVDTICTTGKLSDEERTRLMKEGRCFRCHKLGHMSRACPETGKDKGKNSERPRSSQGQYIKDKPKVRAAVINEDEEDQHSEAETTNTSTTAPPSYTKKDVLQYIRGMSIEDHETLYEEMSAQADF
jgi:hypothetical protein